MRTFLAWITLISSVFTGTAYAAVITVVPSEAVVGVSDSISVDLVISDLGDGAAPSVGVFDLNLSYDSSVFGFTTATFGDQLDLFGFGSDQIVDDTTSGIVNVFELSFDLAFDLDDLQAPNFTLVTLDFTALAGGVSDLTVSVLSLGDSFGDPIAASIVNSSVRIEDAAVIPVPGALPLLISGLAGLGFYRRCRVTSR